MVGIPILSFRLLLLFWITAKRQQIHDRTASRTEWNQSYDFVIVGAGAAGCVVANRLAANPNVNVLLLEAGGAQDAVYNDIPALFRNISDKRPDLQYMYRLEPQKHVGKGSPDGRILMTSGKTLGGSTTHNDMVFNRGHPKDYDLWEHKYGAKGWNFAEVLPYFKRFENNTDPKILAISPRYHGRDGPLQLTTPTHPGQTLLRLKKVYNLLGFKDTDINGAEQMGTMVGQSFISSKGLRSSTSNGYIDPNPYPKNLNIVTKAMVTKILFDGLTAVGVEFAKNEKTFSVFAQKEVIISAGAINSPQILMLSGIGPKDHLEKLKIPVLLELPVGNYFKNHILFTRVPPPFTPPLTVNNLAKLYFEGTGPLSKNPFIALSFSTMSNPEPEWPNIFIWSVLDLNDRINHYMFLARVRSEGTIQLQSSSPFTQPLIDPNFLEDEQDYMAAIEATIFMFNFSAHPLIVGKVALPSLSSLGCPSCPGLEDYQCIEGIKCYLRLISTTVNHPCCSCRMGAVERNDVVVDPELRVKNTKNLRVCDASIMPDIPNGNLYAPSIMVGEKCAQIIIENYHF